MIIERRIATKGTKNTKKFEKNNRKIGRFDFKFCTGASSGFGTCQFAFNNQSVLFILRVLRGLRGSRLFSIPVTTQAFA